MTAQSASNSTSNHRDNIARAIRVTGWQGNYTLYTWKRCKNCNRELRGIDAIVTSSSPIPCQICTAEWHAKSARRAYGEK